METPLFVRGHGRFSPPAPSLTTASPSPAAPLFCASHPYRTALEDWPPLHTLRPDPLVLAIACCHPRSSTSVRDALVARPVVLAACTPGLHPGSAAPRHAEKAVKGMPTPLSRDDDSPLTLLLVPQRQCCFPICKRYPRTWPPITWRTSPCTLPLPTTPMAPPPTIHRETTRHGSHTARPPTCLLTNSPLDSAPGRS